MTDDSARGALAGLAEDFDLLDDWEARYGHIIELGRQLAPLDETERNEATRVRGCASQVWLVCERRDDIPDRVYFRGDSDAAIVRGLIALLVRIYSGRTPQDILALDAQEAFTVLGLSEALTPQRSNGFAAMVARMRQYAEAANA